MGSTIREPEDSLLFPGLRLWPCAFFLEGLAGRGRLLEEAFFGFALETAFLDLPLAPDAFFALEAFGFDLDLETAFFFGFALETLAERLGLGLFFIA